MENYPFIKSHDGKENDEYSDNIKEQMNKYTNIATEQLKQLRLTYPIQTNNNNIDYNDIPIENLNKSLN